MRKRFFVALVKVVTLCVIVFIVNAYFVYNSDIIGFIVFGSGLLCLLVLKTSRIPISTVWPDIIFGVIDNGILAVMAVIGGKIAGVAGAIIGGVVGNAITDGIAGVFEGQMAEKLREQKISEERTMLGSAVGKMAGCFFGAGLVLIVVNFLNH